VQHALLIAAGLALLAVSWVCWTGRWRGWSRIAMLPLAPITALPAVGIMFAAIGAGALLPDPAPGILYGITALALVAGVVIWVWDPRWYGPAWYRERDTTYDLSVPLNAAIATSVRTTPGVTSEQAVQAAVGGREPVERWRAHLVSDEHGHPSAMQRIGVVRGHLLLYEDAIAFAADVREDRMRGEAVTVVIPAASIHGVTRVPAGSRPDGARTGPDLPSRVMPRLRVDTDRGPVFFEAARAGRRAEALAGRYVQRAGVAR
jgi:hypothetical protein